MTTPHQDGVPRGSQRFQLSALQGHPFVVYFYPRDNTPGCTDEGRQFRDLRAEFRKAGVSVLGISRDSLASHEGFKKKMGFPFELLSDPEEKACEIFGVMKMKNMYGRQVRGVERGTFVKVPGHAQAVLDFVKTAFGGQGPSFVDS